MEAFLRGQQVKNNLNSDLRARKALPNCHWQRLSRACVALERLYALNGNLNSRFSSFISLQDYLLSKFLVKTYRTRRNFRFRNLLKSAFF